MRKKNLILLTLTLLMMSVVVFAQNPGERRQHKITARLEKMRPAKQSFSKFEKSALVASVRQKSKAFELPVPFALPQPQRLNVAKTDSRTIDLTGGNASNRAASDFIIIDETPVGEAKQYKRTGGYYLFYDDGLSYDSQSGRMTIVFAEGNEVYMKDPIAGLSLGTWVKGTLSGDGKTITVPLNQNLYYSSSYDCCVATTIVNYTGSSFNRNTEITEITYTIDGETITQNGTDLFGASATMLGLYWTDDFTVYFYNGEWGTVLTETELFEVELPSGVTPQTMYAVVGSLWGQSWFTGEWTDYGTYVSSVQFAQDGDEWYIQGLSVNFEEAWIKGTTVMTSGDLTLISFPSGQYIGTDDYSGDDYYLLGSDDFENESDIYFIYDKASGLLYQYTSFIVESYDGTFDGAEYILTDMLFSEPVQSTAQYNFDNGNLSPWTTIDADGDGETWYIYEGGNGLPGYLASSDSYNYVALTPDNYLVSPLVNLGGKVSFYAWPSDENYPEEHFGVAVSILGNTDPADFTMLEEWTLGATIEKVAKRAITNDDVAAMTGRQLYEVDLSEFAGKKGYVAIRHFGCTDQYSLNIDDINIEQPTTFTPSVSATKPIEFTVRDGADLFEQLAFALDGNEAPAYINLKLVKGGRYTISRPLEVNSTITIEGDAEEPAMIDASELGAKPFMQITDLIEPVYPANDKGFYDFPFNVTFKNLVIPNLQGQLFYANKQKYIVEYLTVDNCAIGMIGAKKKTFFDFNGGGFVENLTVNNSTLACDNSTTHQNGGFFSTQSGTKRDDCGASKFAMTLTNNTFYKVSYNQTPCTYREKDMNWMSFTVENNIIVNSGKKGQFIKGLNQGSDNANPLWYTNNNSFQWVTSEFDEDGRPIFEDISALEEAGCTKFAVTGHVEGPVVFLGNVDEANMSLGNCAAKLAKIGDPRWLLAWKFIDIEELEDAQYDLSWVVNEGIKAGYNIFVLPEPEDGEPYLYLKTLSSIKTDKSLVIKSNPKVRVNAGYNADPFIVLSKEPTVPFTKKFDGSGSTDYYGIDKIQLDGLWVICMRNSILWDQNVKYCVEDLKINNCVLSMTPLPGDLDGMPESLRSKECKNEAVIAFQAGGAKDVTVINSTICDNTDKAVAKYFIRFNNSARLDRFGYDKNAEKHYITYRNNTFYGLLKEDGQWANYSAISGQNYVSFDIVKNIWFDCGKDIIRRLSGGRIADGATVNFEKNTYVNGGELLDETGYDKSETQLNTLPKFKFELTGNNPIDFFHWDEYTLCTGCAQHFYKTGDPRWFADGGFADGYHYNPETGQVESDSRDGDVDGIETVEAGKVQGEWYTIQGVRVDKPGKGLYIHNGKKVLVK